MLSLCISIRHNQSGPDIITRWLQMNDSIALNTVANHAIAYAHSLPDQPKEKWETMEQHEQRVAELCAKFLGRIHPDLAPWGDLLGRWHDLGKYHSVSKRTFM